ncbi:MAG: DUF368 domain-containing protein [Deltaproteobacteria bacterium]|nr:DUF368 domain-containing protein [Deltaproteobacteria bacterium]
MEIAGRGALGGALMGAANLVPGVSGGTMLLAAGVYPACVEALADLSMLRFRRRSLMLLAVVTGSAVLAVLLLSGAARTLVLRWPWAANSLFLGLTLGGAPLLWRMAQPRGPGFIAGAVCGAALLALFSLAAAANPGSADALPLRILAGAVAGGAMLLPGVSGGTLLLLLGQYLPLLAALDQLKRALTALGAGALDTALFGESLAVLAPIGIGVLLGVAAAGNGIRAALRRAPSPTLGALFGLLLGAVAGLWPFLHSAEGALQYFAPSALQLAGALALALLGFAATSVLGHFGSASGAARGAHDSADGGARPQ